VNLKSSAILIVLCLPAVIAGKSDSRELASAERKFAHIETNGRSSRPNPAPTILTEAEVNAYLASDNISLPAGVQSVKLEGDDGVVTGNTRVDFDRIREGAHSSNPLLSIVVHAHGSGGRGQVHVDSVSLDTIEVPRFVLQLFVDKFLKPKYPELGLDSEFALPDRIDMATVGKHERTIVQK